MTKITVVFDFDGTIADSLHLFIDAINKFSTDFNYKKIKADDVLMLQEKRPHQILRYLHISLFKLPFVLKRIRREINKEVANAKPSTDILDTLLTLKKHGCKIGILTSNTEQNVKEFLINNHLDVFDFLYSSTAIFGKGRILRSIIKRTNKLEQNKIFYVGDEIRDIEASRKTGVKMIAVSWGFNTIEALKKENPDYTAKTPQQILDIILYKNE